MVLAGLAWPKRAAGQEWTTKGKNKGRKGSWWAEGEEEQAAAGGCQAVDSGCGQAEDDRSDVGGVGAGRFLRVAFGGPGHPLDSDVGAHERLMADIRHAVEHRDQDSGITARAAAQLADSG